MNHRSLLTAFAFCLFAVASFAAAGHPGYGKSSPQSYLGVDVADVREDQAASLHLDGSLRLDRKVRGAQITQLDHDGPAGKAGLSIHDIVLKMNGQWVNGQDQFRKMLRRLPPGKSVTLTINRGGQTLEVTAQLADRDEVMKRAWDEHYTVPEPQEPPSPQTGGGLGFLSTHIPFTGPYTGVTVDTMSKQLSAFFGARNGKGLLVENVEAGSPGALSGLRAGDVVIRINGREMDSSSDWSHAVRESKDQRLPVVILRDHKELTLWMTPGGKRRTGFLHMEAMHFGVVTL